MNNLFLDKIEKLKVFIKDNFVLVYVAISFICFAFILNTGLFTAVSVNQGDFFSAYKIILFPEKRIEILSYLITIPMLFVLLISYLVLYLNIDKLKKYFFEFSSKMIFSLLGVDLFVNLLICLKLGKGLKYTCVILLLWLIILFLPLFFLKKIQQEFNKFDYKPFKICVISFIILFSIFNIFSIFKPLVFDPLYIYNEVNLIPVETIIKDYKTNDSKIIDNNTFINENNINGYRKTFDIRYPERSLAGDNCLSVSDLKIKDVLNSIIDKVYIKNSFKKDGIQNYFYIADNKVCYINELTNKDLKLLKDNTDKKYWNDIDNIYYSAKQLYADRGTDIGGILQSNQSEQQLYEILQYQKANKLNPVLQNVSFWINHQNHILSTMTQLDLGKNPNEVFMQYGYGTTLFLQKMLNLQNGFNFQDYYHSINIFYYIYYVALFALMFLLLKNPLVVATSYSLLLIVINKFMYIHYHIAPGANPLRHFFDIFVVGVLYYYFKTKNKWLLIFADLCCLGGIFIYPSYGLILTLAMVAMYYVSFLLEKNKFELHNASILLVVSLFAYKIFNIGLNYGMDNYLYGLSGFLATKYGLMLIYAIILLSYILIIKNIKAQNKENVLYRNLLFLLTLYSQGINLYFITISEITHFLVVAPVFILTLFVFGKLLFLTFDIKIKNIVQYLFLIFVFYFAVITYNGHIAQRNGYFKEIKAHPVYDWTIKNSNFKSNMNPKYFEDSIALMKNPKYSNSPEIYMISQYDALLMLLSDKYNALPYIELQWYMTKLSIYKDLQKQLFEEKPKYIFTDNIFVMDNMEALVDKEHFRLKLQTYNRLKLMKNLFETVKENYKPVESSMLITVWERIN